VLIAIPAPIRVALAMVAMAARMVARATLLPTAVNPPVTKPMVARTMAAMTVVAVRTTVATNAPGVKSATIGGMSSDYIVFGDLGNLVVCNKSMFTRSN
jgi:hypothetical protein